MLDGEMTATVINSQNPLQIPELLDNILEFLPVKDLKNCRLVNKFWKDTALKPMRKNCAKIKYGSTLREMHGVEHMEKFLQCFSADPSSGLLNEVRADDIPCTKFEIRTSIINQLSEDREKLIVAKFLQAISPWVTEITLEEGKDIGRLLNGVDVEELKFPSLKTIVFSKIRYGTLEGQAFSPWMSVFVTNSPQLQKLELHSVLAEKHRDPLFFQFLSQNKGLKIKELSIHATIENEDLTVLSESDLKLKSLTLRMHSGLQMPITNLTQLLKSQSETLEELSIFGFFDATESAPLPFMKQLKTIRGSYPGLIDYAKVTPSLEIIDRTDWLKHLNGELKPATGVKMLGFCCRWNSTSATAQGMLETVRIFSNISKLEIPAHNVFVPIVYDSLPNLEELTLSTIGSIDVLLTGMTYRGCKLAARALGNWTPDFDDSDIRIGTRHSPISVLTNLKLLRLRSKKDLGNLELTAVSLCLVLMKMPSFQVLDLCERREAPHQLIPTAVLEEFRKNRLIVWKPKLKAVGNGSLGYVATRFRRRFGIQMEGL